MKVQAVNRILVDLGILERRRPGLDEEARKQRHAEKRRIYRARLVEAERTGQSNVLKRGRPRKHTTEEETRAAQKQYQATCKERYRERAAATIQQLIQAAALNLNEPDGIDKWCQKNHGGHSCETSDSFLQVGLGISHSLQGNPAKTSSDTFQTLDTT
jgi:hypothetical protein